MLRNPGRSGTPAIPSAPTVNAPKVIGIVRPRPARPEMRSLPVAAYTAPAQKKRVIFVKPWAAMWNAAPVSASGVPIAPPRTM